MDSPEKNNGLKATLNSRLFSYKTLALAAASIAAIPEAGAEVHLFNAGDIKTPQNGYIFVDLDGGLARTSPINNRTVHEEVWLRNFYVKSYFTNSKGHQSEFLEFFGKIDGLAPYFKGAVNGDVVPPQAIMEPALLPIGFTVKTSQAALGNQVLAYDKAWGSASSVHSFNWGNWLGSNMTGYAGFSYDFGGGSTAGWLYLTVSQFSVNEVILHEFGYNDVPGGDVVVPEPAHTALLMAAGAIGIAAYRRRKAAKAEMTNDK